MGIDREHSIEVRTVLNALGEAGRCAPCLAAATGLSDLVVRGALAAIGKTREIQSMGWCRACGDRRLTYGFGFIRKTS